MRRRNEEMGGIRKRNEVLSAVEREEKDMEAGRRVKMRKEK